NQHVDINFTRINIVPLQCQHGAILTISNKQTSFGISMRTPQYMATCLLNIPSLPITMRKMTIYSPLSTLKTSG
ncbi:MAG: hypothetical protein ACRDCI_14250, partial [Plesiomonas shigelloides]